MHWPVESVTDLSLAPKVLRARGGHGKMNPRRSRKNTSCGKAAQCIQMNLLSPETLCPKVEPTCYSARTATLMCGWIETWNANARTVRCSTSRENIIACYKTLVQRRARIFSVN